MPLYKTDPFEYKRKPPKSYLTAPDIQDYQGRYASQLAATPAQAPTTPAAAAPTSVRPAGVKPLGSQNWWGKLGKGGQSALMRAALAAGSAMLERTDPEARNPFTAISKGVLTGLETHDVIKEEQRGEALRSRLADIDVGLSSAEYAGEVAKTYAGAGEVKEALGAFEAQSRLAPETPKPAGAKTVGPRQGIYDLEAREWIVDPSEKPDVPFKPQYAEGQWWTYDKGTGKMNPITKAEAKYMKVGPNTIVVKQRPDGSFEKEPVVEGIKTGPAGKDEDIKITTLNTMNKIHKLIVGKIGKPPVQSTVFGVNPGYLDARDKYYAEYDEWEKRYYERFGIKNPEAFKAKAPTIPDYPTGGAHGGTLQGPPLPVRPTGVAKDVQDRFFKSQEAGLGYRLGEVDPETGYYRVIDKEGNLKGYYE